MRKKKNSTKTNTPLDKKLIRYIKSFPPGKAFTWKQLIKQFSRTESKEDVVNMVKQLINQGRLVNGDNNRLSLGRKTSTKGGGEVYEGRVDVTKYGYAYIVCEGLEKDPYVASDHLGKALHGDVVKIQIIKRQRGGRVMAKVIEVVKRTQLQFIGTVHLSDNYAFLVPDQHNMRVDIFIPKGKAGKAKDGEKAIAKILDWPDDHKNPLGEIVGTLGEAGSNEVEMQSILIESGFNLEFPKEVMDETKAISEKITKEEIEQRRDFRNVTTLTIDPDDAKDFDDALSLQELKNGNYEVGIHIADVSHYVKVGSALDKEALERATSVYLVDRVLPMLPEKLSNKVCSLRPEEEKLTFSTVFEITPKAEVVNVWYGRTVICSDKRFTYNGAQELIEGNKGKYSKEVNILNDLAVQIREERVKNGSILFESKEVKFKLDEDSKPIGVYVKEMKAANQLIEEFMLLANKYVAKYLSKLKVGKSQLPSVYRVHDVPDTDKLDTFSEFAKKFGYKVKFEDPEQTAAALNDLLKMVQGRKEQDVLQRLAIRSMAKATYTTKNIGHYGLAFDYYTHFTSPIRRYPDVLIHRILQAALTTGEAVYHESVLSDMCSHSSAREKGAMEAERNSVKYKQVEYMQDHVGEEFEGMISGVIERGIFVELVENKCEGMIPTDKLGHYDFMYDDSKYLLRELGTGRSFQMGDMLKVRIVATNLEKREIDMELAELVDEDED